MPPLPCMLGPPGRFRVVLMGSEMTIINAPLQDSLSPGDQEQRKGLLRTITSSRVKWVAREFQGTHRIMEFFLIYLSSGQLYFNTLFFYTMLYRKNNSDNIIRSTWVFFPPPALEFIKSKCCSIRSFTVHVFSFFFF